MRSSPPPSCRTATSPRAFLPDKAIDLLDQAAARVKLSATARPVAVQELESELHQLRREQDYVASRKQYDKAAELGKRIEAKETELKKLVEEWERERASGLRRSQGRACRTDRLSA